MAILRAVILYELGRDASADELERCWDLTGLGGLEERWRDERLWLLSGLEKMLELRCFYFHLKEECGADQERIRRVKRTLLRMRAQTFELQECLKYCSPLGPVLRDIRRTMPTDRPPVGPRSIKLLEDAGIQGFDDLESLTVEDLIRFGIRRDLAKQIRAYVTT
jgi:helicase